MNKFLSLTILACVLAMAFNASGAQSAKGKSGKSAPAAKESQTAQATPEIKPADDATSGDAKSGDAKEGDKPAAAGLGMDFGGGDFPFDKMEALSVEFNPDGLTVLTGKVRIESKDFNISCELLKMDNKTKLVTATGNPVIMDQGPQTKAQCRSLVYNLDTRSAMLENDASIIQDQNGRKTKATADMIKIDQDKAGGKPKVSLMMREGSPRVVQIEVLGQEAKPETKTKGKGATRVNESTLGQINIPVPSKVPGVE